jgi:hypothetical protein
MKKRLLLMLTAAALGMVFLFTLAYAAEQKQEPPDTITMNSKVYAKQKKKKLVSPFSHKKHADKPDKEGYGIACTDCHHRFEEGKKENLWKEGEKVDKCDVCHKEAKPPKKKKGEKKKTLTPEEKLELIKKYHQKAIHANCQGCHKDLKKKKEKTGPTACKDCHPKPEKGKKK